VLGFVTSLPHPVNCASYEVRCELLGATLRSVLAQTVDDIAVVVVANEPPVLPLPADDRIELCLVPFGPKASPPGKPSPQGIFADKGAKLAVGTARAAARGASHVMWVDSDDFVHRDIARVVAGQPEAPGWYFDAGYFHVRGTRRMREVRHDYHQHNGSSHVVRTDLVGVPAALDGLDREEVLEAVGRDRAIRVLGRHQTVVEFFEEAGTPLAPFPFPAAVWELGTGENCTGVVTTAGARVPLDDAMAATFGMVRPGPAEASRAEVANVTARLRRRLQRA
jgi:hypothetical protein